MSLQIKPRKRLIGYARVSTQQQDLARQIKALKR
ncbi:MAG: recombinase family protein, partial [Acidobacteria bacterium]|nr:recombinase family protein [Acidobacteriota bacterium]